MGLGDLAGLRQQNCDPVTALNTLAAEDVCKTVRAIPQCTIGDGRDLTGSGDFEQRKACRINRRPAVANGLGHVVEFRHLPAKRRSQAGLVATVGKHEHSGYRSP